MLLKFIKKIVYNIVQIYKTLSILQFKNRISFKKIITLIFNIFSILCLSTLFYFFMLLFKYFKYSLFEMFQIIIFTLYFFAVFIFISDNFKISNNKFIKFIQKLVFFNCILALIVILFFLILYLLAMVFLF